MRIRKRIFTLLFLIACWTSYSDLTAGSLPASQNADSTGQAPEQAAVPFQRMTIQPGDTLLSVSERMNETDMPISQVIEDFSLLNPSVDPNHLKIGETYAFPYYDRPASPATGN